MYTRLVYAFGEAKIKSFFVEGNVLIQKTLTLGILFDGSGGFPLGGILAGIEPVWSAEIEPFPVLVWYA